MLKLFDALGKSLPAREIKGAMLAASRPVEQAARRNLRSLLRSARSNTRRPKGRPPGYLAWSMKGANIRVFRKARGGGTHKLVVGPAWPAGAHGTLLEFGTYRQKPRPFLRPAWDANRTRVGQILVEEYRKRIEKVVRRNARLRSAN